MGDLNPEQEASYLGARRLTRPDGIKQTLADIDLHAADPRLPDELRELLVAAGITIRSLHDQVELKEALLRLADRRHDRK